LINPPHNSTRTQTPPFNSSTRLLPCKERKNHKRPITASTSSTDKTTTSHLRNTSLPTNRTSFYKSNHTDQQFPQELKQNPNSRNYHNIPNNKYNRPTMTAATGQGTITAATTNEKKHDAPRHFYKTKTSQNSTPNCNNDDKHIRKKHNESSNENQNKWPTTPSTYQH